MSSDVLTVLTTVEPGKLATKTVRLVDGEWQITPYGKATWFRCDRIRIDSLTSLARALDRLQGRSRSFVIRGAPLPATDRARCRRLLYPQVEENGELSPETFEPAPRFWIALDFDDLPTPTWNEEDLARRRGAIQRDYAERNTPDESGHLPAFDWAVDFDDEAERITWEMDIAGDAGPAPIDPARDWPLVCRAAIGALPPEFDGASCYWQMTSSAGIKPGIRLRLWFWLDRPVSDAEARRWLADAPVDCWLYSPVQPHYTAAPIFVPRSLDPVPVRSGMYWRHRNTVAVPELPEPEFVPVEAVVSGRWHADGAPAARRAEAYAEAALRGIETATTGNRHPTLMGVAVRVYSLCDAGLLDPATITLRLLAAAEKPLTAAERRQRCAAHGGRPSANEQAIDWARARARAAPDLPDGFQP